MPDTAQWNTIQFFVSGAWVKYKVVPGTYSVVDQPFFAEAVRQNAPPDLSNYLPEISTFWDTWHRGYGELYWSQNSSGLYYTANGVDGSIERQLTLALAACSTCASGGTDLGDSVRQFIELKGIEYAIGNQSAWWWQPSASPNGWMRALASSSLTSQTGQTDVFTVPITASTSALPGGQYLYIPTGSNYWVGSNPSTWTSVPSMAAHFATIRNELWLAYYDTNSVWWIGKSFDGSNFVANNTIQAGNGVATINGLLVYDNYMVMMTTQGFKTIDQGGQIYDIGGEIGKFGDPQMGVGANVFHGQAYIPTNRGLVQYTGGGVLNPGVTHSWESVGPDVNSWQSSDVRGKFAAVTPDLNFMYGTLNSDSGNGYLMKYRDYPDLQPGEGWHPIQKFAAASMGAAKVTAQPWYATSGTYPILWVNAGHQVFQMRLPVTNDNPLSDPNVVYQTSGTLDLPILDDGMPNITKLYSNYLVELSVPTNCAITMYAQYSANGTFNAVSGALHGTTGVFEFDFAQSGTTANTIQPRIQLTASVTGVTSTVTPYVRSIVLSHTPKPTFQPVWHFQAVAEDDTFPGDNVTAAQKVKALRSMRNTLGPFPFIDMLGDTYLIQFQTMSYQEVERKPGVGVQFIADCQVEMMNFTGAYTQSAYTMYSLTS